MLEVLKFIFSSFWHWLGFAILLTIAAHGLGSMFSVRVKKVVTGDVYDDEDKK